MQEIQEKLYDLQAQLSELEEQSAQYLEDIYTLSEAERSERQRQHHQITSAISHAKSKERSATWDIDRLVAKFPSWFQAEWAEIEESEKASFLTTNRLFEEANEEAQIGPRSQRDLTTVRDLTITEWEELYLFVEKILVGDFGIFLPRIWFAFVGVATECLQLLIEFLAIRKAQVPMAGWFTHLEAFLRRVGAPWTEPPFEQVHSRGEPVQRLLAAYAPKCSGLNPEPRVRHWQFRAWLVSEYRPLPLDLSFPAIESLVKDCSAQREQSANKE